MNLAFKISVVASVLFVQTGALRAEYQAPASFTQPKHTIKIGQDGYGAEQADDSSVFQRAIDDVSAADGGHVVVPAGEYHLIGLEMKSDVHVLFDNNVVIRAPQGGSGNIFNFGGDDHVQNVSVVGPQERVIFDFTKVPSGDRLRVVGVSDCINFRIANMTINDHQTTFSSIILGWNGVRDGQAMCGRDGLIENLTANDAHYGYGALQAHAGQNITFRNIKSVGGVAVRLETGLKPMNKSGIGGLFNIVVENVSSVNGQGALMMQPHTMNHGDVVARNISADGSEFAVYVSAPFVSKKRYEENTKLTPGSFKSIKVDGVKAVYRDGPIVTRYPHLKYYPEELHDAITREDNGPQPGFRGPSIAAVGIMQPDASNISVSNVEAIGYKYHPDIITPKDQYKGSVKHIGGPAPAKGAGKKGSGKKSGTKRSGNKTN